MQRKAHNRLWTLILMLSLCATVMGPAARIARADSTPIDPVPGAPPDPQAGDPDSPSDGRQLQKQGNNRGNTGHAVVASPTLSTYGMWMLKFRMAFAAAFRLFRF